MVKIKREIIKIDEVPCCYGLISIAQEALKRSGKDIPFESIVVGIKGEILKEVTSKGAG